MLQQLRLRLPSLPAGHGPGTAQPDPATQRGVAKPGVRGLPSRGWGAAEKGRFWPLRRARTDSRGLRSGRLGGCERQIFLILSKEILF